MILPSFHTVHVLAYYWLIGTLAFPFLHGLGCRLTHREGEASAARMAVWSVLWPLAVWGVVAATISDIIRGKQ